jgi:osmotically-inducible protein OsmY
MHPTLAALAATLLATLALAGCSRGDDRTAGQKLDAAIAQARDATAQAREEAGQAASDIRSGAREAGADARVATAGLGSDARQAAADARDKVADAAITTSVNADLAKDPELSALQINVDTSNGHVALHGNAPSAAAKQRATQLASAVKGVASVDNQLVVETR